MSVIVEEVSIKDGISGPAKAAAQELTALSKALSTAQDKMTVASAMGNIKAYRTAQTDVSNLKAAISALPPHAVKAEGAVKDTGAAAIKAATSAETLQKALASTNDAMVKAKALGDKDAFKKLSGDAQKYQRALSGLPPQANTVGASLTDLQGELAAASGGLSVVAEAAGALVVGLGALVVMGAKTAIEASEAKAKWVSLFDALGEGKISGQATLSMLDELGTQTGQTREKLAPLTKEFLTMGITGTEQLKGLTLAAASAGAMADGGAEAFTKLFQQANAAAATGSKFTVPYKKLEAQLGKAGLNIGDLATQMHTTEAALTKGLKAGTVNAQVFADALQDAATAKGAGPLARAGASLGNVWSKFLENINKMFEDIDVGPFLDQVKDLFGIFDQGTASGQTLKAGVGGFFKEVFSTATKAVPLVKHFLLDLVIYGLKGYIALKPIVGWFKDLQKNQVVMAVLRQAFNGLKVAAVTVAVAIGVVVGIFAGLAAISFAVGTALWALVGTVVGFTVDSIAKLGEWVTFAEDAAINFVKGLIDGVTSGVSGIVDAVTGWISVASATLGDWAAGAANIAKDFIAGLLEGITSGASAVVDAVSGIADKAKNAFKNALGIHSPSTVMMALGDNVAGGVAVGMKAGASDVSAASNSLAQAAVNPMAGAPMQAASALVAPKINAPSLSAPMPDSDVRGSGLDLSNAFAGGVAQPPAQPPAPPAAAGGKGDVTVHIDSIQINGANKSIEDISLEVLSTAFEQAAMHAGAS